MTSRRQTRRDKSRGRETRTPQQIVGAAQSAHHDARRGLAEIAPPATFGTDDALIMLGGVKTFVMAGRQVIFILRKLKRITPFEGWLAPIEQQIDEDPLLNYFASLRDTIEKEGLPPLFATIELRRGDERVGEAYVRVTADLHGIWTSGSVVGADDPEVRQRALTADNAQILTLHVEDPPTEHLGRALATDRIDILGDLYLHYLWYEIIEPAREKLAAEAR
jgi:hypothetical protein